MPKCCVVCLKYYNKGDLRSFHMFPRHPVIRKKWLDILGINITQIVTLFNYVCSDHFLEDSFYTTPAGKKFLKHGAIPTIQISEVQNSTQERTTSLSNRSPSSTASDSRTETASEVGNSDTESALSSDMSTNDKFSEEFENASRKTTNNGFQGNYTIKLEVKCRTCLSDSELFNRVTDKCTKDKTIKDAILLIQPNLKVAIKDDDDYVCNYCLDNLKTLVNFVEQCCKADDTLWAASEITEDFSKHYKTDIDSQEDKALEEEEEEESPSNDIDIVDNFNYEEEIQYDLNSETDVLQEIKFWNECSKNLNRDFETQYQKISTCDKIDCNDEKLISTGPLTMINFPKFLSDIRKKVQIVRYGNALEETKKCRILLLGSNNLRKCPICDRQFSTESVLKEHFEQDHNNVSKAYLIKEFERVSFEKFGPCEWCGKTFTSIIQKQFHASICYMLNCPYCNKLILEEKFKAHMRMKHPKNFPLKCYKCNQEFHYYRMLKYHKCDIQFFNEKVVEVNKVEKKEKTHTRCVYCRISFPKESYDKHVETNHKNISCSKCTKKFVTKRQLENHMKVHEKVLCPQCGKFIKGRNLHQHLRFNHHDPSNPVRINCTKCKETFSSVKSFYHHKRKVHEKYVICELCGLKCRNSALKTHVITIHSDIKEHECQICQKRFSRKDYLARHVWVHGIQNHYTKKRMEEQEARKIRQGSGRVRNRAIYIKNPPVPIRCKFCLKTFSSASLLKYHLKQHVKLLRYKCQYCDMTYANDGNRKRHEAIHKITDYKHRCNTCWKKFSSLEELKMHESTLHTSKHVCEYCNKSFPRKFVLMSHLVDTHYEKEDITNEVEQIVSEGLKPYKLQTED